MRLIVLRHAKADWPEGVDDADRPLTATGRGQAVRVGQQLAELGVAPDHALVSPALRTTETWELVASAFAAAPATDFLDDLYGASARALLHAITERGGSAQTLILVGHNPGVHDLVHALVAPEHRASAPLDHAPATATVLEFNDARSWTGIGAEQASVVGVITR